MKQRTDQQSISERLRANRLVRQQLQNHLMSKGSKGVEELCANVEGDWASKLPFYPEVADELLVEEGEIV
jgi:hypothetical protein